MRSRSEARAGGALAASAAVLALSCGGVGFSERRDTDFGRAVEAALEEAWEEAATAAHGYLKTAQVDDERYDRAAILLARALEQLGLTHAASLYFLDVAQSRRNVELLDEAVAGIERIVNGGPHDGPVLVDGYLATAEITGLRPELQAFVAYHQAVASVRRGLDTWADAQFASIPAGTPYYHRARYALAVRHLAKAEWDDGRARLEELVADDRAPAVVRDDARLALARLALEQERYEDAVEQYEEVKRLAPKQPYLLLEMAWAHFYRGDSRRALGLLVGLDAPIYGGLIAPERYLLEAFCLRRLCQFEPARFAAIRLRERYGDALGDLYGGVAPTESEPLRAAARRRGAGRVAAELVALLRAERARLEDLSLGDDLNERLLDLYDAALESAERREEASLADEVHKLADELVAAEDGVRLILHELGVALLRGRHRPPGPDEVARVEVPAGGERVSYEFQGEFWTDELDDLVVTTADRCLE